MALAVRADQPVRADEHGRVVDRVAVALEQAADDVARRGGGTPPRAPPSTGRESPRRTDSASSRALVDVAGDRALGQDEQLRALPRPPPRAAPGRASRFRSFSASFGSIWATATRIGARILKSDIRMRKIRFYYDIVCPYSYMESRTVEAAEDAGEVEVEWLPFELRPAPKALLEPRGDHLRVDWTQHVYRRALALGVEIHLPRYQPRSTLILAACLWAGDEGGCGRSSTRSTRRSSARARTSRPTRRSAVRPSAPGSIRTARSPPPTRPIGSASLRTYAARRRQPASAACPRS